LKHLSGSRKREKKILKEVEKEVLGIKEEGRINS
jgi:hypothetical protein